MVFFCNTKLVCTLLKFNDDEPYNRIEYEILLLKNYNNNLWSSVTYFYINFKNNFVCLNCNDYVIIKVIIWVSQRFVLKPIHLKFDVLCTNELKFEMISFCNSTQLNITKIVKLNFLQCMYILCLIYVVSRVMIYLFIKLIKY